MSKDARLGVMPIITVDSVDEIHRFYTEKLGFQHLMGVVGKDGGLDFVTVVRSGVRIMFSRAQEAVAGAERSAGKRPVDIYVEVEDVDAYHDQLRRAGVRIVSPLTTQWWGDRTFTIHDPYGYQLWFYQAVAEPTPPQGAKIV
jgi:PhnB protein